MFSAVCAMLFKTNVDEVADVPGVPWLFKAVVLPLALSGRAVNTLSGVKNVPGADGVF